MADEETQSTEAKSPEDMSKYEFCMAAASEAERLNTYYRNHAIQRDWKVTTEAFARVRDGRSRVVYEEPKPPEEETRKESTYFFGP